MSSFALKVPAEVYFMIIDLVPGSTKVSLLQTCHYLFSVVVSALYRHVTVAGVGARLLALTILTCRRFNYAVLTRSICYKGTNIDDLYLTYPLFVDAICTMKYLSSLTLSIPRHHTSTFMTIVGNKGLVRSPSSIFANVRNLLSDDQASMSSRYTLPRLQRISVDGDVDLVKLGCSRQINSLKITSQMTASELGRVFELVNGKNLQTLHLAFFISTTKELLYILYGLSEACPSVFFLTIDTGMFNAMELSAMMSTPPSLFPKLRSLLINHEDTRPPVFGSLPLECFIKQRIHFEKARSQMPYLDHVQFGPVHWQYPSTHVFDGPWRSDAFSEDHPIDMQAKHKSRQGKYSCLYIIE